MKITNQLPNYEIKGLSKREHDEFWKKENRIYKLFERSVRIGVLMSILIVNIQYFFITFPVPFYWFLIITFIHIAMFRYL